MRIPRDKVHWAWVREEGEAARVIESHTPPLIGNNEEARQTSVPLLAADEEERFVVNKIVDMPKDEVAEIEARAFKEGGD